MTALNKRDVAELRYSETPSEYLTLYNVEAKRAIQRAAIYNAGKRPSHTILSSPTGNRKQRRIWAKDNRKKGGAK